MPSVKAICFLPSIRFAMFVSLGCSLSCSLLMGANCFSQDESLEQLQQQWTELSSKFDEKEAAAQLDGGNSEAIQAEYQALIDQADALIGKIDAAAVAILKVTPNDPKAIRARLGIMINEVQNQKFLEVMNKGEALIQSGINPKYFGLASKSERLSMAAKEVFDELLIRQAEVQADDLPRVKFTTTQGDIVFELFENESPGTVGNFISLVESDYYTDRLFHHVVDDLIAQTGGMKLDAEGVESNDGGPGYKIKCECYSPDARLHFTHSLSMVHGGRDTGGAEFFITLDRTSFLDGRHTCFGRVIEGRDVLEKLTRTHLSGSLSISGKEEPIEDVKKDKIVKAEVVRKRDHEYLPNKIATPESADTTPASDTDDSKSDESKADESKSDDVKSDDSKSDDSKSGDSKSGDSKSGDSKSGDSKSGDSTDEDKAKSTAPKKESDG